MELTGRADELAAAVERHERRLAYLRARVAEATGQSTDKVGADMCAGRTLSAADAVAYGLVHELVRGSR